MSDLAAQIAAYKAQHPTAGQETMARALGVSRRQIRNALGRPPETPKAEAPVPAERYFPPTRRGPHAPQRETAVLVLTDSHYGKEDTGAFRARLGQVGARLAKLRDTALTGYSFDELVVCGLGDFVDGAGIYPSQAHEQFLSDPRQQATEFSDVLGDWLLQQRNEVWGTVRVEAVAGNHGMNGKFSAVGDNYDVLVMDMLSRRLAGKIEVGYHARDPFLRRIALRRWPALLYHGHRLMTQTTTAARIKNWSTTHLAPFSVAMFGHIHSLEFWRVGGVDVFRSGTMLLNDAYALEKGFQSSNEWWLFGVSDSRPTTWQFKVDLT